MQCILLVLLLRAAYIVLLKSFSTVVWELKWLWDYNSPILDDGLGEAAFYLVLHKAELVQCTKEKKNILQISLCQLFSSWQRHTLRNWDRKIRLCSLVRLIGCFSRSQFALLQNMGCILPSGCWRKLETIERKKKGTACEGIKAGF